MAQQVLVLRSLAPHCVRDHFVEPVFANYVVVPGDTLELISLKLFRTTDHCLVPAPRSTVAGEHGADPRPSAGRFQRSETNGDSSAQTELSWNRLSGSHRRRPVLGSDHGASRPASCNRFPRFRRIYNGSLLNSISHLSSRCRDATTFQISLVQLFVVLTILAMGIAAFCCRQPRRPEKPRASMRALLRQAQPPVTPEPTSVGRRNHVVKA